MRSPAVTDPHPDLPDREYARDVADVERLTKHTVEFALAAAVAAPVWFILLLVFPQLGLGAGLSLLFASLVAGGLALALRKVFGSPRARRRSADGGFRIPKALKVASVIGVLWIVLYLVLIARGGN